MSNEERRPLIFNIHHFALDNGPGIRTTVFFKGCPLSCFWCHNPESMSSSREIAFYPKLCIQCGDCMKVCNEDAVQLDTTGRILREKCSVCGRCAEICPARALRVIGAYYSAGELVEILMKDRIFYETSNGGVTFSGGEPALYADYAGEVMKELKKNLIHIAIQTSGMFDMSEFKAKLLPYIDLIYYDIKLFDSEVHRKYTGSGNSRILENFIYLIKLSNIKIIPRMPLIPGITATQENLSHIADFLSNAGCLTYELLPYNSGGIAKRHSLGKTIPQELAALRLDVEREKAWRELFNEHFFAVNRVCV
ncbi:MAG: glycyl-radical enzyme activating protein [Nitrospirota bacterium]